MKTFHFHNLNLVKTVLFLSLAVMCFGFSFFEIFTPENSPVNRMLNFAGYIIMAIHFTQTLWHKQQVSYNKKGLTIRKNRNILQERTFMYKYVKDIDLKDKIITFNYRNNPEIIDLSEFEIADVNKVYTILNN